MRKLILIFTLLLLAAACSVPTLDEVLTDKRTQYKKSESLPPLDVPPDLSTAEKSEAMNIPGETTTTTFKKYKNRNNRNQEAAAGVTAEPQEAPTTVANATMTTTAPAAVPAANADGSASVSVRGDKSGVWNQMRTFLTGKGYQLDLDDFELGYMETQWSAPTAANGLTLRQKFKLYSEAGADPGVTVFYIDNARQEQVTQGDGNIIWMERNKDTAAERLLAGEMNAYFSGPQQTAAQTAATVISARTTSTPPAPARRVRTEIQNLGEGKLLLAIPEEYTMAWRRTGEALQMAGLIVNGKDPDQGVYNITYNQAQETDSGWTSTLKKLKFWGNDKSKTAHYQVALTGVGNKTELVLLDADGGWVNSETAGPLLTMIQAQYDNL